MLKKLLKIYILLFPIIPMYAGIKFSGLPLINFQRVVASAILFIFLINIAFSPGFARRAARIFLTHRFAAWAIILLFLWKGVSVLSSVDPIYSGFIFLLEVLLQFAVFLAVCSTYNDEAELHSYAKILSLGFFAVLCISVVEYAMAANPFTQVIPSSMMEVEYLRGVASEKTREGAYRVQATFMHPLALAEYVVMIMPLVFSYLTYTRRRAISALAILIGIAVVYFTGSRAGLGAVGLQIFALVFVTTIFFFRQRRWMSLLSLLLMASIGFISILPKIDAQITSLVSGRTASESMSTEARLAQVAAGVEALRDSPLVGFGPGLSINYAATFNVTTGERSVDNYYLSLALDSGYFSLAVFTLVLFYFIFLSLRAGLSRCADLYQYFARGAFVSLLAFFVYLSILSSNELFTLLFLIFALVLRMPRTRSEI